MTAVWGVDLPLSEKLVLLALADASNDEGICWPSVTSLFKKCSLSERAVRSAIGALAAKKHLTVHERAGRSNYYTVHPLQDLHPCNSCTPAAAAPTPATGAPLPLQDVHHTPATGAPIIIRESKSESSGNRESRAPKRARSRTVPEDFQITDALREWAKAKAPNVNLEAETEKFRDHEFRDPHSDWPKAWRQWMRRSPEFKQRGNDGSAAAPKRTGSWREGLEDPPHADK
jgi:hypothetical protein